MATRVRVLMICTVTAIAAAAAACGQGSSGTQTAAQTFSIARHSADVGTWLLTHGTPAERLILNSTRSLHMLATEH